MHDLQSCISSRTSALSCDRMHFVMDSAMSDDKKISISEEEYDSLLKDSILLNCLQMMGVDNWDGYDEAIEQYNEIMEQEEK